MIPITISILKLEPSAPLKIIRIAAIKCDKIQLDLTVSVLKSLNYQKKNKNKESELKINNRIL